MRIIIITSCVLLYTLVLNSCAEGPALVPSPVLTSSETPLPTRTSISSTTAAISTAPTLNNKTIIITPDDMLSLPRLEALSTPNSRDFCEHLPLPQVDVDTNEFALLVGRFSLCVSRSWPWVKTAMDLDTGTLVSSGDKSAEIDMYYTHPDLNGEASYFVSGLNNAHIDGIDTTSLTYSACEKSVLNLEDPGSFDVDEGGMACVLTTEGKMAVIRVEHIYPPDTQGVEFSFAILRKE